MKRAKLEKVDMIVSFTRQRSIQILLFIGVLYLLLVSLEIPLVFRAGSGVVSQDSLSRPAPLESEEDLEEREAPSRPLENISRNSLQPTSSRLTQFNKITSGLALDVEAFESRSDDAVSEFYRSAKTASEVGKKFWGELESGKSQHMGKKKAEKGSNSSCPHSISLTGTDFLAHGGVMMLPCGLTLGSHITLVGKPRVAQPEYDPKITMVRNGEESVMVSQFIMELQGLNTVEGEAPPRILHFNPRLKGDWSGRPVIELNTCYRMQWGSALRCEGWKSKANEDTVDGQVKCEKWIRDDEGHSEQSKAMWWLNRLIGRTKRMDIDWPYPFAEDKLFVLTLSAGFEGYHVNVDGKHVISFPYRTGFALEDATGLSVIGDIDVQSVLAASLPRSHPSFAPQQHLEMSRRWQAPPLPDGEVDLFIGILSAGNHFAERMAVRKSWMRHRLIKSSKIVARFFVALHARKEVNVELKKEAEFFGDIVIVPYMDTYDLVVLKTVAICEYGVHAVSAKYIMKCDDDTFVKVDSIMNEIKNVAGIGSVYIGNINYYHKPLRDGKWAVTYEEWPEEDYPPYANGPGYIVSSDIAHFVISNFERHKLRLFKMEDVSMGMWVEQFNSSKAVKYVHSFKYCQFGCIEEYYTAHYQSPRQMICLWNKLQRQVKPECCNMR